MRSITKRGIMVEFLVTVILALIIFVPTCIFISNFFRLSDQAQVSFLNFSKTLEHFPQNEKKDVTSILIFDENTFVIGYNQNKDTELCTSEGICGKTKYPTECQGQSCLCLCTTSKEGQFTGSEEESIRCSERSCRQLPQVTFASGLPLANVHLNPSNSLTTPAVRNGYFKSGFILGRGTLSFSGIVVNFENVRRQFYNVVSNAENSIYFCDRLEKCNYQKVGS